MPYGATDSTAPGLVGPFGGLGGREPGRKVGQTFRGRVKGSFSAHYPPEQARRGGESGGAGVENGGRGYIVGI